MTLAELCLLGMVVLTIAAIAPAKIAGRRDFDNANPRDPGFYTPGLRARSLGAHQNGLEAFPLFATAVLLAEFRGVPRHVIDGLALAFLALRVAYVACYLGNRPGLRSLVWSIAMACNVAIFLSPVLYPR